VTQATNRRAMLKVNRQAPHIYARHAAIGFDVETVRLALAKADQTFLSEDIETESFGSVIQGLGGNDKKEAHGLILYSG